jgi:hypothetical protein
VPKSIVLNSGPPLAAGGALVTVGLSKLRVNEKTQMNKTKRLQMDPGLQITTGTGTWESLGRGGKTAKPKHFWRPML